MKMNKLLKKPNDWRVAYSPYVDTLHVYRDLINKKSKEELIDKDYGDYFIIFESDTRKPLLFEMKSASSIFGKIDNMDKKTIIHKVEGYIKNHGQQ